MDNNKEGKTPFVGRSTIKSERTGLVGPTVSVSKVLQGRTCFKSTVEI